MTPNRLLMGGRRMMLMSCAISRRKSIEGGCEKAEKAWSTRYLMASCTSSA
jgi:hypothetical protein